MPRAVMIVMSSPIEDSRDEEFNNWYTKTHVPDVLKVPGFVAATRYRLSDTQIGGAAPEGTHKYLAIYELDTDDLAAANAALIAAATGGQMEISETLDMSSSKTLLYEQMTDRMTN